MKNSDLTGAELDFLVALKEGLEAEMGLDPETGGRACLVHTVPYSPSSNWEIGGPLLEKHRLIVGMYKERGFKDTFFADMPRGPSASGETLLIAAMRCIAGIMDPDAYKL